MCWLPDGDSVLFSYLQAGTAGLFRVDLATRQVSPWPGAEHLHVPEVQPAGRVFAMSGRIGGGSRRLRPGSSCPSAEHGKRSRFPAHSYANWSRDGQALIGLNTGIAIERFSLATRRSEVIADVRGLALARVRGRTVDGPRRDGAPLVTRDPSTFDLYALDWEAP